MKYIIFYMMLLATSQAQAWIINADFESGVIGDLAQGKSALSVAFDNTRFTQERVHSGKQAAVSSIVEGDTAFGRWGGSFKYPIVREGGEIWYRAWVFYPYSFSVTSATRVYPDRPNFRPSPTPSFGIGLKTLRIQTRTPPNGSDGYFDLLTNGYKDADGRFDETNNTGEGGVTVSVEQTSDIFFGNKKRSDWETIGKPVTKGVWHAFEQYVKLSSVPGEGIYRVWLDGELVLEDIAQNLKTSTSESNLAYIWSYYNGGAPKDQKAYIDDVIVTNEPPSSFDSLGNRFIGVGGENFTTAPPNPPTIQ